MGSSSIEAVDTRGSNGNLTLGAEGLIALQTQDTPTEFSTKMVLENDGDVGIGTTLPQGDPGLVGSAKAGNGFSADTLLDIHKTKLGG